MREPATALLLLFMTILCAACHGPSGEGLSGRYPRHNIVLVTVDTLRADHLGAYGYPRRTSPTLDAIAKEGILFEQAFSPTGRTWPSLTAMLTSLYPRTTNVRKNGDLLAEGVPTLLTVLQESGYTTAAFLANACSAFGPGIDLKRCDEDAEVTRKAIEWLRESPPEPFLIWIHYMAPHSDYAPPRTFDVFRREDYAGSQDGTREKLDAVTLGQSQVSAEEREHVVALYDGEILYADTMLGILWSELRSRGLLDRSVAAITADHGEDLGQHHDYFYHACSVHDSTLHIPLVIRLPDGAKAGDRFADPVGNMDIAPTLLDLVGLDPPAGIVGESLVPRVEQRAGPSERVAVSEFYDRKEGEIVSLRSNDWRFVYNPKAIRPRCEPEGDYYRVAPEALYDLASDPNEARNVLDQHPDIARRMRELAVETYSPEISPDPIRVDRAEIQRLRALGYLER